MAKVPDCQSRERSRFLHRPREKRKKEDREVSRIRTGGERCGKPLPTCGFAPREKQTTPDIVDSRVLAGRPRPTIRCRHRTLLRSLPLSSRCCRSRTIVGKASVPSEGQCPFSTPVEEHVDNAEGVPPRGRGVASSGARMPFDRNGTHGSRSRWEEEHSCHKHSGPKTGGRIFRTS